MKGHLTVMENLNLYADLRSVTTGEILREKTFARLLRVYRPRPFTLAVWRGNCPAG